jgi:1,4-dihydroxy-2-naphthoate octaprenyltransferase
MPVFLFALAMNFQMANTYYAIIAFVVLHVFVYPASNGYNSYFDKDEGSIGGLKEPPKVTKDLYWAGLAFDTIGVLLAMLVSFPFALMVFIYGMVSKAYSHPSVRLKKYPFLSWFTVGIFQGAFTYLMVSSAILDGGFEVWTKDFIYYPALLSTILLLGSYPMTQIYQHEEDSQRGDITISIWAGIKGTFILTAMLFLVAVVGFYFYFKNYQTLDGLWALLIFLAPVFGYFSFWFFKVLKDEKEANFEHTMRFNMISSLCLITYFSYWCWAF